MEIETRNARLEFKQKHAKVNIETELPRVLIDQYECFASAGLKSPFDLTREAAQRGYQQAMEYIGKYAQDGDTLAAIEQGGYPIADIVVRDAYPEHIFDIDFIPKARPKITVTGGIKYDAEKNSQGINNGVEGTYTPGYASINYTPAKVSIYMEQYNSIKFGYQDPNLDIRL